MSEEKHDDRTAPVAAPVMKEVARRWSPRAFDERPVSREELRSLFEAARWSASAYNEQPWRFVVASRDDAEGFERLLGCLNEWNRKWAHTGGALIMVAAKTDYTHNGEVNAHARYDAGQAAAWLTAQAVSMGLQVHQMAGFSARDARERLGIPDGFEPVTFMALGRVGDPSVLPGNIAKTESAPRDRRPLSETIFEGRFGTPHRMLEMT